MTDTRRPARVLHVTHVRDIDVGRLLITGGVAAADVEGSISHLVAAELSARDEAVAALLG